MSFIRTVLGDQDVATLGACDAHEHLIINHPFISGKYPDFQLDDPLRAAEEMRLFRASGGGWIVDTMPTACGRDVLKLAEASRQSGVHVICPTGRHLPVYYEPGHWMLDATAEQLAARFIADIEQGIAASELQPPPGNDQPQWPESASGRTPHRAGVIKVAAGDRGPVDEFEAPFAAAAEAHRRTGCPIITHTEGKGALEQAVFFARQGVPLGHVVLSHTDKIDDLGLHRELLSTGVCLEYDQAFRWDRKGATENPSIRLVAQLCEAFPDQLMLGTDLARRSYHASYGGTPGVHWLMSGLRPRLAAHGVSEAALDRLYVTNPARAFSFAPVAR